MIASIAVSAASFAMDKPFSYRSPRGVTILPGMRVSVPFGPGNRLTEGVILRVEEGDGADLKVISDVLDEEPVLNETMLRLAAFIRQRYFCTFYDAVRAMLPAGLWFRDREVYAVVDASADHAEIAKRKPEAVALMNRILEMGGSAEFQKLKDRFPDEETLRAALRYLIGKKLLCVKTTFQRKTGDKTERLFTLACSTESALSFAEKKSRSAPLQAEVLRFLTTAGSTSAREVQYFTGASAATLHRLESLGLIRASEREIYRQVRIGEVEPAAPMQLNAAQQDVYKSLIDQLDAPKKPALLYGVTGSGKTAVYLNLIRACLEKGKSAMLLVPEIALTPQLMRLVSSHFGGRAAMLHSSLRIGERYDEWKRVRSGEAKVVIGTRSAVFAPAQDLGLIILDEEQEHTYKSQNAPRYHAREVAIWRGAKEKALVLLGSATPSIESMYRAKSGEYDLYRLVERYNQHALPAVELADMRQELKNGNGGTVSRRLLQELQSRAEKGEQAILFLNRRGNSRFVVCVDCGDVPQCPRCSVSLTYHSANRRLMCHYCGYSEPVKETCPVCGGHRKPVGAGTQRVEQELSKLLPESKLLRMDADTVTAANNHDAILQRFRNEKIPILLGTQMVAKGLDFPNVTLVGVLDADLSLYVDHFRAAETTFSMITQVVGRAGRGGVEGSALIQTMTPENKILKLAASQDYDGFYEMEIRIRELRNFPPFSSLIRVSFFGDEERHVSAGAAIFRRWLEQSLPTCGQQVAVLGPSPAPIVKVNNRYHYQLTLNGKNTPELRKILSHLLREFGRNKSTRDIGAFADADPYE